MTPAVRLAEQAEMALPIDVRQALIESTYMRANCLTVVSCALRALGSDWERMDAETRKTFIDMAQERAADLVDLLKRDIAALEFTH
jgi:hypothetical protein